MILDKFFYIKVCRQICEKHLAMSGSILRFVVVGGMNTAVDFTVFSVLKSIFDVSYSLCQVAGYSMGMLNSFIFNKIWTFDNKYSKLSAHQQVFQFLFVNIAALAITLLCLRLLIVKFTVHVYWAKIIVTGISFSINYLSYKYWVFME